MWPRVLQLTALMFLRLKYVWPTYKGSNTVITHNLKAVGSLIIIFLQQYSINTTATKRTMDTTIDYYLIYCLWPPVTHRCKAGRVKTRCQRCITVSRTLYVTEDAFYLRIQLNWDVTMCRWVSASTMFQGPQCPQIIQCLHLQCSKSHTQTLALELNDISSHFNTQML